VVIGQKISGLLDKGEKVVMHWVGLFF